MRSRASDRTLVVVFLALAGISLAIKAGAGAPVYVSRERRTEIEQRLVSSLSAQGFATSVRHLKIQSPIIYAKRGDCILSVRDAAAGADIVAAFADDARAIGPVRYLYKGGVSSSPPSLRIRLGNFESSLLHAAGFRARLHVPIALATSDQCRSSNFNMQDMRITV